MFGQVLVVQVVVGELFVCGMVDRNAARNVNTRGVGGVEIPSHMLV